MKYFLLGILGALSHCSIVCCLYLHYHNKYFYIYYIIIYRFVFPLIYKDLKRRIIFITGIPSTQYGAWWICIITDEMNQLFLLSSLWFLFKFVLFFPSLFFYFLSLQFYWGRTDLQNDVIFKVVYHGDLLYIYII